MLYRKALVLAAFVLVAGCGDRAPSEESTPGAAGEPAVDSMPAPAQRAGTETAVPVDARLEPQDDGVTVVVALDQLVPGARYSVMVHEGTCADGGPIRLPLGRVTAREDGTGSVRMTVDRDRLPDAPLFAQVLSPDGPPAGCGDFATGSR